MQFRVGYGAALSVLLMIVLAGRQRRAADAAAQFPTRLRKTRESITHGHRHPSPPPPGHAARGLVGACAPRLAVLFSYPLYVMLSQSLKDPAEAAAIPPTLYPHKPVLRELLGARHGSDINVFDHVANSAARGHSAPPR